MNGELIVALDLDRRADAEVLVGLLGEKVGFYKIGYQLFYGGDGLDFRSDQCACGAILYEWLTGKPAFPGETAIYTLSAILHHDPEPITRSNPRAPVQLSDLIRRLLSKSADDRYASSRDLARELRLLRDRVVAEESGFHKSQPMIAPRTSWRAIGAAVVIAALVTVSVMISRNRLEPAAQQNAAVAPTPAKKYLAVMRFKDLTGDATGQLVVDGFAETLTARLAHYPAVQVMRPSTADAEANDALKAARDLGANLVLTGSMMRELAGSRSRTAAISARKASPMDLSCSTASRKICSTISDGRAAWPRREATRWITAASRLA